MCLCAPVLTSSFPAEHAKVAEDYRALYHDLFAFAVFHQLLDFHLVLKVSSTPGGPSDYGASRLSLSPHTRIHTTLPQSTALLQWRATSMWRPSNSFACTPSRSPGWSALKTPLLLRCLWTRERMAGEEGG